MANIEYRISFNISEVEINDIKNWLIVEQKVFKEGFYCNWDIIKSAFNDNHLIVIFVNEIAVGFAIWTNSDYTSTIDIVEIKPTHRMMGLGRKLITYLLEHFKNNNIYVAQLQCCPESSEPIWRKLDFVDFPDGLFDKNRNKQLYKILVLHLKPVENNTSSNKIELWNDEPYRTMKIDSRWKWDIEYIENTSKLKLPIIAPAYKDWRMKWEKDGICFKDDKVKYFNNNKPIDFGAFIIIEELDDKEM